MNNQNGVAHILGLIILVLGLAAGLYLIQHPQVFKPRAGGGPISRPISGPIVCKEGVNSFAVESPCGDDLFAGARFQCHDGQVFNLGSVVKSKDAEDFREVNENIPAGGGPPDEGNVGIGTTNVGIGTTVVNKGQCKTSEQWSAVAKKICQGRSSCNPKKPKDNCPPTSRYCPTTNSCLHVSKKCPAPSPTPELLP